MSLYKVLPLPISLSSTDENDFLFLSKYLIESKKKIEPVFDRLGMYLDRKNDICWVETHFGCWIVGNKLDFQCELEYQTYNEYILPNDAIKAFRILNKHDILPKELMDKWYRHTNAVQLRYTYWSAVKRMWLD